MMRNTKTVTTSLFTIDHTNLKIGQHIINLRECFRPCFRYDRIPSHFRSVCVGGFLLPRSRVPQSPRYFIRYIGCHHPGFAYNRTYKTFDSKYRSLSLCENTLDLLTLEIKNPVTRSIFRIRNPVLYIIQLHQKCFDSHENLRMFCSVLPKELL